MKKRLVGFILIMSILINLLPTISANAYDGNIQNSPHSIYAGDNSIAIITPDKNLWMCGLNDHGQIGDGSTTNRNELKRILSDVMLVSSNWHTAAIKTDGSLWTWGDNEYGQLGDGTTDERHIPTEIMDDVKAVATGVQHTLVVKSDGSLWAWGRNNMGQLGDGTTTDKHLPVKIMDGVIAVSAGSYHTAAIKTDGSLWVWGSNDSGAVGNNSTADAVTPQKIMENVAEISLGASHTTVIKTDGSLWAWGSNHSGALGDGTNNQSNVPVKIMDGVKSVAAGGNHTAAIKNDDSLWIWGYNYWGALGTGDGGGSYSNYKVTPVKLLDDVIDVSSGWNHTVITKNNGDIFAWGHNEWGALGDGTFDARYSPVKITNINDIDKNAPKHIKIGDYINMGTYYGEPMVWRCISFEKITGYDENGNPIIDSTDTVKEYKEGYLPLMLADKIICLKPYDASGFNTSGSHGRGMYYNGTVGYFRKEYGSNYWGDSNIRCWLNSDADAGQVEWLCGNPPTNMNVYNHYNEYDSEAGFLTNFTSKEREIIKPVTQKAILDGYEYDSSTCVDNYFIGTIKDIDEAIQNYDTAYSEMITDSMFLPDVRQAVEIYNNSDILGEKYYVGKLSEQAAQNSELKNEHIVSDGLYTYYLRTPMTVTGSSETQSYHDAGSGLRTIDAEGQVSNAVFGVGQGIRPAFFLTEDVNFTYGDGTENYPYAVEKYSNFKFNYSDSYTYYHDLARMSFEMACAGFSAIQDFEKNGDDDSIVAKNRYANIEKQYDINDFDKDSREYHNYGVALTDTSDKAAYSMASRNITVDGETRRLIALVVRGGDYGGEWVSNFRIGSDYTYSEGFKKPADNITSDLKKYIEQYKDEKITLWMTGYSRGAAITNLVAANIDNFADECSYLDRENIFVYTFATPRPVNTLLAGAGNKKYNNIFNIVGSCDFVPNVLLDVWGFGHFGVTKTLFSNGTNATKNYYKNLTGNDYIIPASQKTTISMVLSLLHDIVGSKQNYNVYFQDIVEDILSWAMVYKKTVSDKASILDYAVSEYGIEKTTQAYQKAAGTVNVYADALLKLGLKEEYINYIKQFGAIFELHNRSIGDILKDVVGSNKIDFANRFVTGIGICFSIDDFSAIPEAHEPRVYQSWLYGTDNTEYIYAEDMKIDHGYLDSKVNQFKLQQIQCPVDLTIKDANGDIVVSVKNREIIIDELPVVVVDDKIKVFYYDNYENYKTEITAYESGEVNYYVSEYADEQEIKRVCYNNIAIETGDMLTGAINDELDTDTSNYDLTLTQNGNNTIISNNEVMTEEQLENLSVKVAIEGDGAASSIARLSKGDYVTLTANPFKAASFIGWYDGANCISQNSNYSFVVDKNYDLIAKFTNSPAKITEVTVPNIADDMISNKVLVSANENIKGTLIFTKYVNEQAVGEYECNVDLTAGNSAEYESQFDDDLFSNKIVACLYDESGELIAEPITASIVRELPEYLCIVNDITVDEESVLVSVTNDYEANGTLFVCSYDNNGALIDVSYTDISESNSEFTFKSDTVDTAYVKAFIWKDVESMKPLSQVVKKEI